jgi:hypothetical protein
LAHATSIQRTRIEPYYVAYATIAGRGLESSTHARHPFPAPPAPRVLDKAAKGASTAIAATPAHKTFAFGRFDGAPTGRRRSQVRRSLRRFHAPFTRPPHASPQTILDLGRRVLVRAAPHPQPPCFISSGTVLWPRSPFGGGRGAGTGGDRIKRWPVRPVLPAACGLCTAHLSSAQLWASVSHRTCESR